VILNLDIPRILLALKDFCKEFEIFMIENIAKRSKKMLKRLK